MNQLPSVSERFIGLLCTVEAETHHFSGVGAAKRCGSSSDGTTLWSLINTVNVDHTKKTGPGAGRVGAEQRQFSKMIRYRYLNIFHLLHCQLFSPGKRSCLRISECARDAS
jgi:hypothetical protein